MNKQLTSLDKKKLNFIYCKDKLIIYLIILFAITSIGISLAGGHTVPIQGISKKYKKSSIATISSVNYVNPNHNASPNIESATKSQTDLFEPITIQDAIQSVLEKVPGADINDIDIKLKNSDDVLDDLDGTDTICYVGTVQCGKLYYDFEIDGRTGHFIAWE